ncbi:hypothetical protein [Paenibacillus pinihumi]|uniref:hypothetical protein n=1 Tax=Paenibacillus pinihumi TaxID=669462 RepID=UPI000567113B|nr:hypothetical protein [Paenibacillus pinihumi]
MKLKKLLIAVMVVCMLLLPQSAFAATGFGDTEDTAMQLTPRSQGFEFFLSNSSDVDWYKWTNTTTNHQAFWARMIMPKTGYYKFQYKIKFNNDDETQLFESLQAPNEFEYRFFSHIIVPAGATLYLKVSPNGFNPNDRFYSLLFDYY